VPSLTGAVCTTKNKNYIDKIAKKLNIPIKKNTNRQEICDVIMETMLNLEKHSVGKDKKTYVMVPKNHEIYQFPYNIEDRIKYIKNIVNHIDDSIDVDIDKSNVVHVKNVKSKHEDEIMSSLEQYKIAKQKNGYIIEM
jgi:hypothetical protein